MKQQRIVPQHRRISLLIETCLLSLGCLSLMACSPKFGQHPQGERLKRVEASPNYQNGAFRNQIPTPLFSEDNNVFTLLLSSLSSPEIRRRPEVPVPSVKTDLNALDVNKDVIVWLGHSSLVLRLGGKSFLVDPVFSNYAAPFSSFNKAFAGTNIYSVDDMPDIDYLLIMHDHWDHLDYPTITGLKSKVRHVICGLGVGAHLEYWGYDRDIITEGDWYDSLVQEDGMSIHIVPARHSSGRFLTRNKTLWAGFVVETPEHRIFISGDTGFGPHFAETGKRFGGFDLAILENGQYDPRWPYTHMAPEETVQAAKDLRARAVLPVHSGKFSLAPHPWDEPLIRLASASQGESWQLLTPMMGEPVYPDNVEQPFTTWWVNMKH